MKRYQVAGPGPSQYHLTLRFVGEVETRVALTIEDELSRVQSPSFTLQGHGLGVFPSRRDPRVVFAAIDPAPGLRALQTRISETLQRIGLDDDTKPFHPHITLARLRRANPHTVRDFLRTHAVLKLDPFHIAQYYLYESILRRSGALHRRRATFDLVTTK